MAYSSGSPKVQINYEENTDERSAVVRFADTGNNSVFLTVTQAGRTYGLDDIHDIVTDQPAGSQRRQAWWRLQIMAYAHHSAYAMFCQCLHFRPFTLTQLRNPGKYFGHLALYS